MTAIDRWVLRSVGHPPLLDIYRADPDDHLLYVCLQVSGPFFTRQAAELMIDSICQAYTKAALIDGLSSEDDSSDSWPPPAAYQ